jgi:hypothetical protein
MIGALALPSAVISQPSRESLEKKLNYARWLKTRIEIGQAPCYDSPCQLQKSHHLQNAFQKAETLPLSFQSERLRAFGAAYQMIDDPWVRPEAFFPEDLQEWRQWWEHRFRNDSERSSSWMAYAQEVLRNYAGLDLLIDRLNQLSAKDKSILKECLDKGALRIGFLLREAPLLHIEAERLLSLGRIQAAETTRNSALKLSMEREELEKNFSGQYEGVMLRIFPGVSFRQIISAFHVATLWMEELGHSDLQSAALLRKLKYFRDALRQIHTEIQSFNDVEFGVLGLRNFHTSVNPLVAHQQEIIIQSYLDVVDGLGRSVASLGTFYLAHSVMAGFTESVFWRIVPLAAGSTLAIEFDFELESLFWTPSSLTGQLGSQLPKLEEESEKRFKELLRAYQTVSKKIEDLENQLSLSELSNLNLEGVNL